MEICARIDRDGPGVVQFNSGKILGRIRDAFPTFHSDAQDLLHTELEHFLKMLQNNAVPEPQRTILEHQMRGKSLRNGPVYRCAITLPDGTPVTGFTRRFSVHFNADDVLSDAMQAHIIRFLLSLEAGEIFCDTYTTYFSVPSHNEYEAWALDPQAPL